jgi:hypothetical protein
LLVLLLTPAVPYGLRSVYPVPADRVDFVTLFSVDLPDIELPEDIVLFPELEFEPEATRLVPPPVVLTRRPLTAVVFMASAIRLVSMERRGP